MRATPFVLVVAAVAATGLAPAAGAHTVRAPAARHCVVWIAPTSGRAPSKVSKLRCYTRFSHALRVARGPAPHGFSGATTGVVPHASTLISTDFDNANMAGASLTWTVSNTAGCNGGAQFSAASMPGIEAVVVKRSVSRFAAESLHPQKACELIRAGARAAVERLAS